MEYYPVEVKWLDGIKTTGNAIGNNAAWLCRCNMILLGPHEQTGFQIEPCPSCGRQFQILQAQGQHAVGRVEEVEVPHQQ